MRKLILCLIIVWSSCAWAEVHLNISLDVPDIEAEPYFKPYVAVWLETETRSPLSTLALWYQVDSANKMQEDGDKWLKDLRQWWRKVGRSQVHDYDAVTGATRRPGSYHIHWVLPEEHFELAKQKKLFLLFEASREEGGRSYQRLALDVSKNSMQKIDSDGELGFIKLAVSVNPQVF